MKLNSQAITGDNRLPLLPDVPAVKKSSVSSFVVNGWFSISAPTGTRQEAMTKLNHAQNKTERCKDKVQETGAKFV